MSVTATEEGALALASAAAEPPLELGTSGDSGESFLVSGSMSRGLAAARDEQMQRDRMAGRGGPGGPDGMGGPGMGMMGGGIAEMQALGGMALNDPMGMGGFGAAGVLSGFSDGLGSGAGGGAPSGPGMGGRGGGPGMGGLGGGGGGGGGRGGGGGAFAGAGGGGRGGRGAAPGGRGGRGPNNGAFARFGNRRRDRPTYTGSLAYTGRNSVLDARPFSLNGAAWPKSETYGPFLARYEDVR